MSRFDAGFANAKSLDSTTPLVNCVKALESGRSFSRLAMKLRSDLKAEIEAWSKRLELYYSGQLSIFESALSVDAVRRRASELRGVVNRVSAKIAEAKLVFA